MRKIRYIEAVDKITEYIKEKKLLPGDKLPTYRDLANLFDVSMHTIGNALERMHYKGIVDIRPQSGVFIMDNAWNELYSNAFNWQSYFKKSKQVPIEILKRFSDSRKQCEIDSAGYVLSNLNITPDFNWHPLWKKAMQTAMDKTPPESLSILANKDKEALKQAFLDYFKSYGLEVQAEQLYLSKSAYYSLTSIILTFFTPGTICYYVAPSLMDISVLFDVAGLIKVPLPTDTEGLDINYFSGKIRDRSRAASGGGVLIVTPEMPLSGRTISMKRRREVYDICYKNGIPIIEIDEFRDYHANTLPPIKSLDVHGIVFYIGNLAAMLSHHIDAGWIAAQPELIERLTFVQLSMCIDTEVINHTVVHEMLASGEYRRYITQLQEMMRDRQRQLNSLLEEHISDIATCERNSEVFFWIKFHSYVDVKKMAANKEGLTFADNSSYTFAESNSISIVLTGLNMPDLPKAIKQLSNLARRTIKI